MASRTRSTSECTDEKCDGGCGTAYLEQTRDVSSCCVPKNGQWIYYDWSAWSTTCGSGKRTRNTIECIGASCGGSCPDPVVKDSRDICCPEDGEWVYGEWMAWSSSCGHGMRMRMTEKCTATCRGTCGPPQLTEARTECCSANSEHEYTEWTEWSGTCGSIARSRSVIQCPCVTGCSPPTVLETLETCCPTDGQYEYHSWGAWSTSCGSGTRTRSVKDCVGATCGGTCGIPFLIEERDSCCAQGGGWTYNEWGPWSGDCGKVMRTRTTASCSAKCNGGCGNAELKETRETCCPQPGEWQYGEWSAWSGTCGFIIRNREVGACTASCDGGCGTKISQQVRETCCPVAGEWSDWASESCSTSCGQGTRREQRTCLGSACGGTCKGESTRFVPCEVRECPVHCEVGEWSDVGQCSKTCGTGLIAQRREVLVEPKNDGLACPALTQNTCCNHQPCEVDCELSPWEEIGECSKSCGGGTRTSVRIILVAPTPGGKQCSDNREKQVTCNVQDCPKPCLGENCDCIAGPWTRGPCSTTCGIGSLTESREIIQQRKGTGAKCPSTLKRTDKCFPGPCVQDCVVSDKWIDIGLCSKTCGGGIQFQQKEVLQPSMFGGAECESTQRTITCNTQACTKECIVSEWSAGQCSADCDGGTRTSTRLVVQQPSPGFSPCPPLTKIEFCGTEPCDVDCEVTAWERVGECSKTCGRGTVSETRGILVFPKGNGKLCPVLEQTSYCNLDSCPEDCNYGNWKSATACSVTCGGGTYTQRRKSETCPTQFRTLGCNTSPCAQDCEVGEWSESSCSKSCGVGRFMRVREVITQQSGNGKSCPATMQFGTACNEQDCVKDCEVGDWFDVTPCSATCSTGTYKQQREITQQPDEGGAPCPETSREVYCEVEDTCPGDCKVSEWSAFGTCSKSCGRGEQRYVRTVTTQATTGNCKRKLEKTEDCQVEECKQDCVVSDWTIGQCTKECGTGYTTRERTIITQASGGGKACPSDLFQENVPCNTHECPRDCVVSDWVDLVQFTENGNQVCSASCGPGVKLQTRIIVQAPEFGGEPCPRLERSVDCEIATCVGDCIVSEWADFGTCSRPCDGGTIQQRRTIVTPSLFGRACPVLERTATCNDFDCPEDCLVSEWSGGECSRSCGGGVIARIRTVTKPRINQGKPCPALSDTVPCNPQDCSVDCVVTDWTDNSECSKSCREGKKEQIRTIISPAQEGGIPCPSKLRRTQPCNKGPCENDCHLSQWLDVGECSAQCGGGTIVQRRKIVKEAQDGGIKCPVGDEFYERINLCNTQLCSVDCEVSEWSSTDCSRTCGSGISRRRRSVLVEPKGNGQACPSLSETQDCNTVPCPDDCQVSDWADSSTCSVTCGGGVKSQKRKIIVKQGAGGQECPLRKRTVACNTQSCAIDCEVSEWRDVSACSKPCGSGIRQQAREIITSPENGGEKCPSLTREIQCNTDTCDMDCQVSEWTSSECSKSCGAGRYFRSRQIVIPQMGNGKECPTLRQENLPCMLEFCPVNCQVSEWADVTGECSRSCGGGSKKQSRVITLNPVFGGVACPALSRKVICNEDTCPGDCEMSEWYDDGSCSTKCGPGEVTQRRDILVPPSAGLQCPVAKRVVPCVLEACPIDCEVSEWTVAASCSRTCGGGFTQKTRTIVTPRQGKGKQCPTLSVTEACNTQPCPIDCQVSGWKNYGGCSATCGRDGIQVQVRTVTQSPAFGGKLCDPTFQVLPCNRFECPGDCAVGLWYDVGECSVTCGGGWRLQKRDIIMENSAGGFPCPDTTQKVDCNVDPCEDDCQPSNWIEGPCSATCGYATRTLSRNVVVVTANGGRQCDELIRTSVRCSNLPDCPVPDVPQDCVVSEWEDDGVCSKSCGDGGRKKQKRNVVTEALYGGEECPSLSRTVDCSLGPCIGDGDCVVSDWHFGPCSATCGGGFMTKCRAVVSPAFGDGKSCPHLSELVTCNTQRCAGVNDINCETGEWSDWSECAEKRCGAGGRKQRTRAVTVPKSGRGRRCPALSQYKPCFDFTPCGPQDCQPSDWSRWSRCTVECGGGVQYQVRVIDQPATEGGKDCENMETRRRCNSHSCDTTPPHLPPTDVTVTIDDKVVVIEYTEPEGDDNDHYLIYIGDGNGNPVGEPVAIIPSCKCKNKVDIDDFKLGGAQEVIIKGGNDYSEGELATTVQIPKAAEKGVIPEADKSSSSSSIIGPMVGAIVGAALFIALLAMMAKRTHARRQASEIQGKAAAAKGASSSAGSDSGSEIPPIPTRRHQADGFGGARAFNPGGKLIPGNRFYENNDHLRFLTLQGNSEPMLYDNKETFIAPRGKINPIYRSDTMSTAAQGQYNYAVPSDGRTSSNASSVRQPQYQTGPGGAYMVPDQSLGGGYVAVGGGNANVHDSYFAVARADQLPAGIYGNADGFGHGGQGEYISGDELVDADGPIYALPPGDEVPYGRSRTTSFV